MTRWTLTLKVEVKAQAGQVKANEGRIRPGRKAIVAFSGWKLRGTEGGSDGTTTDAPPRCLPSVKLLGGVKVSGRMPRCVEYGMVVS